MGLGNMTANGEKGAFRGGAAWDRDLSVARLSMLQRALARRGMICDLETQAVWPRLRVHSPYEVSQLSVADFENSVVAAPFDDGWWFAWPWAEKISEVTSVRAAADQIALELGGPDSEARVKANRVRLVPPLTEQTREEC